MRFALFSISIIWTLSTFAQGPYAPASNQNGTSAIHKDSSIIVGWAKGCSVVRGYQDIADPSKGFTTVGDSTSALNEAQTNGVVSLGDGGTATLIFDGTLHNDIGYDFAVFENGFAAMGSGDFLELAFVEVSSDGQNFFRFPAHSLTDTSQAVGSFGTLDPTMVNNLAGKYYTGYGTPFDLEEMTGINGLDVNAISHVRVVDVIGTKQTAFATYDTASRKVLDSYPTAFPSGGFDLDAVAAIHMNPVGINELAKISARVYPNPVSDFLFIEHHESNGIAYEIMNANGKLMKRGDINESTKIDISDFSKGVYFIRLQNSSTTSNIKVLKQ